MTDDVANYYQTEAKDKIGEIRTGVSQALNKIVVREEPEPQVYKNPTNPQVDTQRHTGHGDNPEVETGTPGTDTESAPKTPRHTGHGETEKQTAEDFVMESRWSSSYHYQKNAPRVNYKNEVHHLITDAESQQSDLTQEAHDRGLWNVDRGSNLIRLPSTQAAYQQSPIKVKHRGSHPKWSAHAQEELQKAEDNLKMQYGSLDNVPDAELQQKLNRVETKLKKDVQNTNLGIQRGWIKVKPDGTQKLSKNEEGAIIG